MFSRRGFLGTAALIGAGAVSGRAQAAAIPEAPTMDKAVMQPPLYPSSGPHYQPVVTLNGWSLPWRMNGDWKEFHLVAEPVVREFAPGMKANCGAITAQAPGPTIEAVEGDKVRIFVTNRLPEHTTVHWHGVIAAERHGRRRRTDPAAHPARRDLRLRVHAEAARHAHVSPALRRDGADGDGHDGHVRRPSARPAFRASTATSLFLHERLSDRPGHLHCPRSTR